MSTRSIGSAGRASERGAATRPAALFPAHAFGFPAPLKVKLEREWIEQMCGLLGLDRSQLPVVWDIDLLYGPKEYCRS